MVRAENKPLGGSMSKNYAFVMMVKEKWWVEFCRRHQDGKKVYSFVNRGAAPPKSTQLMLFYVTKPVRALAGYATYIERVIGNPKELWDKYGNESVLGSRNRFEEFVGNVQQASFVRFKDLSVAVNPISLSLLLMSLGLKRLSRKGFYIDKDTSDMLISMME
jgi:predicted transcriptional regulator